MWVMDPVVTFSAASVLAVQIWIGTVVLYQHEALHLAFIDLADVSSRTMSTRSRAMPKGDSKRTCSAARILQCFSSSDLKNLRNRIRMLSSWFQLKIRT